MSESTLTELSYRYPEHYRHLRELIYVVPARGLPGFYVVEKTAPDEEVILEICQCEQRALQERDNQILHDMRCFDQRQFHRYNEPGRWRATAHLGLALKHPFSR